MPLERSNGTLEAYFYGHLVIDLGHGYGFRILLDTNCHVHNRFIGYASLVTEYEIDDS